MRGWWECRGSDRGGDPADHGSDLMREYLRRRRFLRRAVAKEDKVDRWLIIDVMHTGGAALRGMLEAKLGAGIYPTQKEIEAIPYGWYEAAPNLLNQIEDGRLDLGPRRVVCGNYTIRFPDYLPGSWQTAIFLRDPVDRTIELLAKMARREKRAKNLWRVKHDLTNEEFVETQIRNYQAKIFCMHGTSDPNTAYRVGPDAFERAKAALEATPVVGITEEFARSVSLFERQSGITLGQPPAQPVLKADRSGVSEKDLATIRELVAYDIELYALARAKMQAGMAAAA
jgi:hypothetical protein